MKRKTYSYATLRYVHDIATQEFFVVGVAVLSIEAGVLDFKFRKNLGLAGEIFGTYQLSNFRALMRSVETRARNVKAAFHSNLALDSKFSDLSSILTSVFPVDDSALQWTSVGKGLAEDPSKTADRLYARYCGKYDRSAVKSGKSDKDAWQLFHRKLEDRRMDKYFAEKAIKGKSDEVTFPFAWKNGVWHCIETVSFDLSDADAIRDKAHRRAGEMVGIRDAAERLAVYYVLTPPSKSELHPAFTRAVGILNNSPVPVEVFEEGKESALLDRLKNQITAHI